MMLVSPYYPLAAFALFTPLAVVYSLVTHVWSRLCGGHHDVPVPLPEPSTFLQNSEQKKIAIITGSNTGIGFETARSLAVDYGMTVVLACRSRDKGEQAVERIQQECNAKSRGKGGAGRAGTAIFVHPLDLTSSQSIRDFSAAIQKKFPRVDILVNNAGRNTSSDQPVPGTKRDVLFQTNFLGHFKLTAQLIKDNVLPLPQKGSKEDNDAAGVPRIVNLSSVMHHFVKGNVNQVEYWKNCIAYDQSPIKTYAQSKLAAILFTMELNRRYTGRLQSVAVNPGGVNSDIWRGFPRFVIPLFAMVFLNEKQGCRTSVAGAVSDWQSLQPKDVAGSEAGSAALSFAIYLQPYIQYFSFFAKKNGPLFPIPEMLGVFGGHFKATPRLPTEDSGAKAAQSLWQACTEVGNVQWPN